MEEFALPVYSGKHELTCTGYPAIIGFLLYSLKACVHLSTSCKLLHKSFRSHAYMQILFNMLRALNIHISQHHLTIVTKH